MKFLRTLLALLPVGPYSRELDSTHVQELEAYADVAEVVDAAVGDLLEEIFPGSAVELLPDWERTFQIVPSSDATTEERQAAVLAAWSKQPNLSLPYIDDVLETYTGVSVTLSEEIPPLYDSATYDESTFFAWTFEVLLDYTEAAAVGMGTASILAAQAFLEQVQPGHAQGTVLVDAAFYDDTTTPYDLSILGA